MRIPVATYRVQFSRGFTFQDAIALIPYLKGLGVTDLYASPIFRARPGSAHGYDVISPVALNPELGTEQDFEQLCCELAANDIGLMLDIVPNHMAASSDNPWWTDVLENGPSSPYAQFFDINWDPAQRPATPPISWRLDQEEKLLLPILGAPYGTVLENQEIELVHEEGDFFLRYYSAKLPVDPSSYASILRQGFDQWSGSLWPGHPAVATLRELIDEFEKLPSRTATDWELLEIRVRDKDLLKEKLRRLAQTHPEAGEQIRQAVDLHRGRKGDSRSFDLLDRLIASQPYVLAYWKVAREKINYRRFFDVSELVGLRIEDEAVQQATHALIYRLVKEGKATALRIDHIDGLYDPQLYLERLRAAAPDAYIVVEKILMEDESLPRSWPVSGTTGYDFLGTVNSLFVHPAGLDALTRLYGRITGSKDHFEDVAYREKKRMLDALFAGEMLALGLHLDLLAESDRHARDLSAGELRQALIEVTACLPVYRTYIRSFEVSQADYAIVGRTLAKARDRNPSITPAVFDFIEQVLLLRLPDGTSEQIRLQWLRFVMRWQQLTGPVTAKGVEDTALYVYNRLVSLNDVGGVQRAISAEEFHSTNTRRRARWPATMNATSTHDTKRSEDVRARINVISEMPAEWTRTVLRWQRMNRGLVKDHNGGRAPSANDEYLIYQALLGAWPLCEEQVPQFRERMKQYVVKAAREAKVETSWVRPDEVYESCLAGFVDALLRSDSDNRFLPEFRLLQEKIAFHGAINSLSQVLLKILSPGIPDFYQGSVLWDFSLVDPDNRRPVDFETRLNLLEELRSWDHVNVSSLVDTLLEKWRDGGVKLYLTYKALRFFHAHRALLLEGDYRPIEVEGPRKEHAIAFARHQNAEWAIAAVPRFVSRFSNTGRFPLGRPAWRDTLLHLPQGAPSTWLNLLTRETLVATAAQTLEVHRVFHRFPVALLTAVPQNNS